MPIVDVQLVTPDGHAPTVSSTNLADALANVFNAKPGSVWVRLSVLPSNLYAENGVAQGQIPNPVFVRVMYADLPAMEVLESQARAIALAVGQCLARPSELVHIEFAPASRGRVAFGGTLLR